MLSAVLVVIGLYVTYGLSQPQLGTINFRHYCTAHHSGGKYKVSCDGGRHFKNKNIVLDGKSISGITDIELYSFDSVNIVSKTSSDWDKIRKVTIRSSKKVILNFQSSLSLKIIEIDSVEELTLGTEQPSYSVKAEVILLSNIGKLNVTSFNSAEIKANMLNLISVKDVNLSGNLQFSGDNLTISASNLDVTEHSMLSLNFTSIIIKESSKLYIQEGGQSNVSTCDFLIKESYIFLDGNMNIADHEYLGNRKEVKFLNNSFYGLMKTHLHIFGDRNEIQFIGNGIFRSDIGDVLELISDIRLVTFIDNNFGCNECSKKEIFLQKYPMHLGEHNFCDLTCNLTLNQYKKLLTQEKICHQGSVKVDDNTLCSVYSEPTSTKNGSQFLWWIVILVTAVSIVLFSVLLIYFYCKRHSAKFQSMPTNTALLTGLKNGEENQQAVIFRAFSNDVYEHVSTNSDNIYEIVDSPRLNR